MQRVNRAKVSVESELINEIGPGLLVYLGVGVDDLESDIGYLAQKIVNLRIFEDDDGKMNLSLKDKKAKMLVISQFTLFGDCRRGRRPSYTAAASPDMAERFYNRFIEKVNNLGICAKGGIFKAHMHIEAINDGPVTILIDSKKHF